MPPGLCQRHQAGRADDADFNNQGYSFMLRGDLKKAREAFLLAYKREPGNPTIINNLRLLDSSTKLLKRMPEQ
jgi:Flp pilus assembly protein TadD